MMKKLGQKIFILVNLCLSTVGFLSLYGLIVHKQVSNFEIYIVLIISVIVWLYKLITAKPIE